MSDICSLYEINYSEIESFLRENNVNKLLIQAPDGLKKLIPCILRNISCMEKYRVFISSSPTYGGCDLAVDEAYKLNVNAILHIGHNKYPYLCFNIDIPVLYIPAYYVWKPSLELVNSIAEKLSEDRVLSIGLISTIQHTRSLIDLSKMLMEKGFNVYIGESKNPGLEKGQVIGCDYSAIHSIDNYVDAYLVIAGGRFHAIGLSLITNKRVYGVDPYSNNIWSVREYAWKIILKRQYLIAKLRNNGFKTTGIVIGTKPGQYRLNIVEQIVKVSDENNIEYYYIVANELNTERLIAIDNALALDTYVVTSCPRLPIDDLGDFYKPVLTPGEYVLIFRKNMASYIYPW